MTIKRAIQGIGVTLAALTLAPFHIVAAGNAAEATAIIRNDLLVGGAMFGLADRVYTREEIQAASPLEWAPAGPADLRYQADKAFREEPPRESAVTKAGRPGTAHPSADRSAERAFAADWELLRQELNDAGNRNKGARSDEPGQFMQSDFIDFGTADIYTGYRGNFWATQWQQYPWKVVGKLLIDGGGYCTAQSITGAPKNILVTAAHCVYDRANSRFYSGWTFLPAERNGAAPYGQFRWASASVLNAYISIGSRYSDVALIRLQNNKANRPVSFYTGWLGWRQNFPYVASLHSIGYASNISTQWTSMCAAESFFASCEGTDVLVKGCNMTFGSS